MKYKYNPSLRELRFSFNHRLRQYLLENTLDGVQYFVDPTRPKWERVVWFLLTLASVAAIVAIIIIILDKFQTEPTITGLDIMTDHINIEFPQIFVCFDWNHMNYSYIPQNEMYMYEALYNWNFEKHVDLKSFHLIYKNKNNFRKIFEAMSPDCDSLISDCEYRGIGTSCDKVFTKVTTSVGTCCKSKNLEPLKIMDISWSFEFRTPSATFPLRFYFTQNDSSPFPSERPVVKVHFPVNVEFIVDITYTTPDIRYLSLRQRKCYYKQEDVNFNDCEINCFIDKLYKHCKCLPWFLSFVDKTECSISKYFCLKNINIDAAQCNCWISCDHVSYSVREIQKSPRSVNRIVLRNWPTALYKREMRFGYLDLLVSFGGIAGLFLGYSLLTSIEFGYYFTLRTYCGAVVQLSRKQYNIVTVHVVEKLPKKVDINPKYYQYVD
ncbi:Sodium channel protein Nach [Eufriesea mexicana]|uniref:Sodium channel protein Nach n=1 Tax=Eufriesea mexicana TaxID=516756 RepID=A0A310SGE9_9HYME|nr:PREDICTED: sodium channel protein Nach-like [Eufriesea mexicana]OAD52482.1 Sodium channel protein Nach [Eufriesea mexicana]